MLIVFVCILINFLGKRFSDIRQLPLWLDSFGKVFAAYVRGPVSGAVVGCTGNIIYSFWKANALVYSLTSIMIGLSTGILARRKHFETFFGATSTAGGVTILSVAISSTLNMTLYDGSTGNVWGDGVREFCMERGVPGLFASVTGEIYLDFLDKLVTVLGFFFLLRLYRFLRSKKGEGQVTAQGLLSLLVCLTLLSPCSFHQDGTLYVGTKDGKVLTHQVGEKRAVLKDETVCEGVSLINQIYFTKTEPWILSENGIGSLTENGFVWEETGSFNSSIQRMMVDYQDNLWFASSRNGLLQLAKSKVFDLFAEYGMEGQVTNSTAFREGDLYVGTDQGLNIIRLRDGVQIKNDLTKELEGRRIRCIQKSSKGDLWICSFGKGLIRLDRDGKYDFDVGEEYGVGNRVRACRELSDGRILIGTDGNGIVVMEDGEITDHINKEDGLSSDVILRMVEDEKSGTLFIVTSNSICYLRHNEVGVFDNFPYSNNYDLILDDDGEVFVLGSAGIYVVDKTALLSGEELSYTLLNMKTSLI